MTLSWHETWQQQHDSNLLPFKPGYHQLSSQQSLWIGLKIFGVQQTTVFVTLQFFAAVLTGVIAADISEIIADNLFAVIVLAGERAELLDDRGRCSLTGQGGSFDWEGGGGEGPTSFYIILNQFHGAIRGGSIVQSHGCMQIRQLHFKWSPNDVLRHYRHWAMCLL